MADPIADSVVADVLIHVPAEQLPALRRPPAGVEVFFAHVPTRPPLRCGELFFLEIGGSAVAHAQVQELRPCLECGEWLVYWRPESVRWLN